MKLFLLMLNSKGTCFRHFYQRIRIANAFKSVRCSCLEISNKWERRQVFRLRICQEQQTRTLIGWKVLPFPITFNNYNSEALRIMIIVLYEKKIKVVTCSWYQNSKELSIRLEINGCCRLVIRGHFQMSSDRCLVRDVCVSSCGCDFVFQLCELGVVYAIFPYNTCSKIRI